MGCEYKIYGSVTLRRSPEVEVILEALRERLDDAVEVEELDENTIDLTLNFDDSTTVHTPSATPESCSYAVQKSAWGKFEASLGACS